MAAIDFTKDLENVENYWLAKADNFVGWECHHRLETHNSDGERRLVNISKAVKRKAVLYKEYKANGGTASWNEFQGGKTI